ncbi:MAG TPA: four-carbon acid sugar kinase family protein, partial [Opitutaceae bacterium]
MASSPARDSVTGPVPRTLLDSLPPVFAGNAFEDVRRLVGASAVKTVVLDDDPTGTQTVHGIDILADWSVPSLRAALEDPRPCFYVLTNSRSLPGPKAAALVGEIAGNLSLAARASGTDFVVVSRSDSTLRGHFAAELEALRTNLGYAVSGTIVIPAFFEGGRYTVDDVHYVAEGDKLVPAAETEFARDRTFGYSHSNMTEWIEEKTGRSVRASEVISIDIGTLRHAEGAKRVRRSLLEAPPGAHLVVNAAAYSDLEVFVHGLLQAEAMGKRFLLRTAASFVRVRAGIEARPLLAASDVLGEGAPGGLVIVGSYTGRTTAQLKSLLALSGTVGIEVAVDRLATPNSRAVEIARVTAAAREAMRAGH